MLDIQNNLHSRATGERSGTEAASSRQIAESPPETSAVNASQQVDVRPLIRARRFSAERTPSARERGYQREQIQTLSELRPNLRHWDPSPPTLRELTQLAPIVAANGPQPDRRKLDFLDGITYKATTNNLSVAELIQPIGITPGQFASLLTGSSAEIRRELQTTLRKLTVPKEERMVVHRLKGSFLSPGQFQFLSELDGGVRASLKRLSLPTSMFEEWLLAGQAQRPRLLLGQCEDSASHSNRGRPPIRFSELSSLMVRLKGSIEGILQRCGYPTLAYKTFVADNSELRLASESWKAQVKEGSATGKVVKDFTETPRIESKSASSVDPTLNSLNSQELLYHFQQTGDPQAFQLIYDNYYSLALATALSVVGRFNAAEDVVQETFLSIYRGAHNYNGGGVGGYVRTTAYRRALNFRRGKGKVTELSLDDAESPIAAKYAGAISVQGTDGDPRFDQERRSNELLLGLIQREVQLNIRKLPELDRETAVLRHLKGQKLKEIAEGVDAPMGTIKRRIHTGAKRLQRMSRGMRLNEHPIDIKSVLETLPLDIDRLIRLSSTPD